MPRIPIYQGPHAACFSAIAGQLPIAHILTPDGVEPTRGPDGLLVMFLDDPHHEDPVPAVAAACLILARKRLCGLSVEPEPDPTTPAGRRIIEVQGRRYEMAFGYDPAPPPAGQGGTP
jgi:hypothetical protein